MRDVGRRRRAASAALAATLSTVAASLLVTAPSTADAPQGTETLYLVTLDSAPGSNRGRPVSTTSLRAAQDAVLANLPGATPVYRWTHAINGFAVRLTDDEATSLRALPDVARVERNGRRPLAAASHGHSGASGAAPGSRTGGAGVVIGVIDSGLDPKGPVFATVPGLGSLRSPFSGDCRARDGFGPCTTKVIGARWFVDGFGADRVRDTTSLSPADDSGHGTAVASIAAGNRAVTVGAESQRTADRFSGVAPRARLAVYKACWTAPDPADDGCSTADLVSAIDAAVADGVDVLNLSVAGGHAFDTVDRALLGATEAGVFVAAAAGQGAAAAWTSPWVTSVGATSASVPAGTATVGDVSVTGAMAATRRVRARLVDAADAAAPGVAPGDARLCLPGSLDAAAVDGTVVLCERGGIGRIDKSATVALADGVGMVLANTGPGRVEADFHQVPTVHVTAADAARLRAASGSTITLTPAGRLGRRTVADFSATGNRLADLVKPDLTAAGTGVLAAAPRTATGVDGWTLLTGTSAATAEVSGAAADVLSRHPHWSPARVRSALVTSAERVGSESGLRQGSGSVRPAAATRPGLVLDLAPTDYRGYLRGTEDGRSLNLPTLKADSDDVLHRTLTSVGRRATYYSVRAVGFDGHSVRVTPAAIRIGPGQQREFTVRISGAQSRALDSGWITWRGARGEVVRLPLVISD